MTITTIARVRAILVCHGMRDAVAAFRFACPMAQPHEFVALVLGKRPSVRTH